MKMLKTFSSVIFLFFMAVSLANATKMANPTPKQIFSANNLYYIHFNPDANNQKVMHGNKKIWSFHYNVQFDDRLFVSNSGKYVYVVRSKFVKNQDIAQPALLIFSRKGLIDTYSYKKLSHPRPYKQSEAGPIGVFWRIWREDVKVVKPNYLIIKTVGKKMPPINMN